MWQPGAENSVEFRIAVDRPVEGYRVLAPSGELDLHVAPLLRERLTAAVEGGAETVVLDLSDVTFLDSMSLSVIVRAGKLARSQGSELRLVAGRPEIRRIFEITLLDRVFSLETTLEDALAVDRSD